VPDFESNHQLLSSVNQSIIYINSYTAVAVPATLLAGFTCAVIQGGAGQLTFAGTISNVYNAKYQWHKKSITIIDVL